MLEIAAKRLNASAFEIAERWSNGEWYWIQWCLIAEQAENEATDILMKRGR